MKAATGFLFFLLFLAGLALVNLKGMQANQDQPLQSTRELADSAWRLEYLGDMGLDPESHLFVQFNAQGGVNGHGGCNAFSGAYVIADGMLNIGPLGTTRMACKEPAMSYELSFLEALQAARRASLTSTGLTLYDEDGLRSARFSVTEPAAIAE